MIKYGGNILSRTTKQGQVNETTRKLTKSEQLLQRVGDLVLCDICGKQVVMGNDWMMTAERDNKGNFIDKKAVCPKFQPIVSKPGKLLVSI